MLRTYVQSMTGKINPAIPETKCQGLFSTPTIHCMKKSHCRFLHNGSKVIFYSLLITGKLVPKLKFVIYRVKSIQLFALYFMMKVIGLRNLKLGRYARAKMC